MPKRTITRTQNQIQSRTNPFTKSHVTRYRQKGLKPNSFEGSDITRFPRIANNSLYECSHDGLSEMMMPSASFNFRSSLLIEITHVLKLFTYWFCQPIRVFMLAPVSCLGAKTQSDFFCRFSRNFAVQTIKTGFLLFHIKTPIFSLTLSLNCSNSSGLFTQGRGQSFQPTTKL